MFFNKNFIFAFGAFFVFSAGAFQVDAGRTAQNSAGFVKSKTPVLEAPGQSTPPKLSGVTGGVLNAAEKIRLSVDEHLKKSKVKGRNGDDFYLDIRVQSESQTPVKNLKIHCEVYYRQKEASASGRNGFDSVTRVYKQIPNKLFYQNRWTIVELKKFLDSQAFQSSEIFFNRDNYEYYSGYKVSVYNEKGQLLAMDKD